MQSVKSFYVWIQLINLAIIYLVLYKSISLSQTLPFVYDKNLMGGYAQCQFYKLWESSFAILVSGSLDTITRHKDTIFKEAGIAGTGHLLVAVYILPINLYIRKKMNTLLDGHGAPTSWVGIYQTLGLFSTIQFVQKVKGQLAGFCSKCIMFLHFSIIFK